MSENLYYGTIYTNYKRIGCAIMREEYEYEVFWLDGKRDKGKVIRENENTDWVIKPKRRRNRNRKPVENNNGGRFNKSNNTRTNKNNILVK